MKIFFLYKEIKIPIIFTLRTFNFSANLTKYQCLNKKSFLIKWRSNNFNSQQFQNFSNKRPINQMGKATVQYDPQFNVKSQKLIINAREIPSSKRNKSTKLNSKRWTLQEQQKYMNFVKNNSEKFQDPQKWKTFALIAKQVKTRNCDQCKSHHIKIILKHNKSISDLIKSWEQKQTVLQSSIDNFVIKGDDKVQNRFDFQLNNQIQSQTIKAEVKCQAHSSQIFFDQKEVFDVLQL